MEGGGGDGGDGGMEYMQARDAQEKARKKAVISKLNRIFGLPADKGPAPKKETFKLQSQAAYIPADAWGNPIGATAGGPTYVGQPIETINARGQVVTRPATDADIYDMSGYQSAIDSYNQLDSEAEKNKAAREADYSRVGEDVKGFHMDRLAKDLEKVVRSMKFSLLGSGNWGGSGELDERANLDETRNRGVMDIQNLADNTADSVRAADTDKLTSLVAAVNAGMEEADAVNAATTHTSTAAQRAIQGAKGASFANLFDDLMNSYTLRAANRGTGRANDFYAQRQLASVPGSSGGSYSGAYSRS